MITSFLDNVIVIDDKREEVESLLSVFRDHDIACSFFTPTELSPVPFKKNRQLIFLDLSLDDTRPIKDNIAAIRSLLKKSLGTSFGIYGIVLWSKHQTHIDTFKEKLHEDKKTNVYSTASFIVGLDKMKYITQGNYTGLLDDIETALKQDVAATFFLEWTNSVNIAKNKTIEKIYSLMPDYKKQSDDIAVILTKLALNYTGIHQDVVGEYPLHLDAYKAFDEILAGELINSHVSENINIIDITKKFSNATELTKICAHLNSAILIDNNNLDQSIVIPGNVYEIIENASQFESDKTPQNAKNIVMEISPPCDFSNISKRVNAKLIGGFLVPTEENVNKQIQNIKCDKECFYKEVYPINIKDEEKPQVLILDFRYFGAEKDANLKDTTKYKIFFRAKPKLFADILQKFSSHSARLGLSVIHP